MVNSSVCAHHEHAVALCVYLCVCVCVCVCVWWCVVCVYVCMCVCVGVCVCEYCECSCVSLSVASLHTNSGRAACLCTPTPDGRLPGHTPSALPPPVPPSHRRSQSINKRGSPPTPKRTALTSAVHVLFPLLPPSLWAHRATPYPATPVRRAAARRRVTSHSD